MNSLQSNQKNTNNNQLSIIDFIKPIFENFRFILIGFIISLILGIFYSLSLPNIFNAKTTFIPQINSESIGQSSLSGFASLAGINLANTSNSNDIPTSLYPQIVRSIPYRKELLRQKIIVIDTEISIADYFLKDEKDISILNAFKNNIRSIPKNLFDSLKRNPENSQDLDNKDLKGVYSISEEDQMLFDLLDGNLLLKLNKKEGVVSLEFKDEDKFVAAQVVEIAKDLLQNRIIELKVQSAREYLSFTKNQYEENLRKFEHLQDSLAILKDQNLNISSSFYQNRFIRLERDLNIVSSVTEQLANQLEQAKLQVNKNTPVFSILEPVAIPFVRYSPKRTFIVIGFSFLGVVFSIIILLLKKPALEFYEILKFKISEQ